jgi:hypothetical protein
MNIDEILNNIPDKNEFGWTTSKKFKRELFDFFNSEEFKTKNCLEIGSAHGHTTAVLCSLFKQVYGINVDSTDAAYKTCENFGKTNVTLFVRDVYSAGLPDVVSDVIMVDAVHTTECVLKDVENSLKLKSTDKKYFIFDDVGLIPAVRNAIDILISKNTIKLIKKIGHVPGDKFKRPLSDVEGSICIEV